jgi:hypothetical protein
VFRVGKNNASNGNRLDGSTMMMEATSSCETSLYNKPTQLRLRKDYSKKGGREKKK